MAMFLDPVTSEIAKLLMEWGQEKIVSIMEVPEQAEKLRQNVATLRALLAKADGRGFKQDAMEQWLKCVKDTTLDAEDIIERIQSEDPSITSSLEPITPASTPPRCSSAFICLRKSVFRQEMASKIKELNERIDQIYKQMTAIGQATPAYRSIRSFSTSQMEEPDVVGSKIKASTTEIVELLLRKGHDVKKTPVFAITGAAGMGKTTLAQMICKNEDIQDSFQSVPPIWVRVSQNYSRVDLLRTIIAGLLQNPAPMGSRLNPDALKSAVKGKKLFLVLDDIWDKEVWNDFLRYPLQSCEPGSRVLITTRNEFIVKDTQAVHFKRMTELSPVDGWALIRKIVFQDEDDVLEIQKFQSIGMDIVRKCDGLPLALKTVAELLIRKQTPAEWEYVLQKWSAYRFQDDENFIRTLRLSYDDLPSDHLKDCFTYCALFPRDDFLRKCKLLPLWIAEGFVDRKNSFLESEAEDHWKELRHRSLLQPDPECDDEEKCQMREHQRYLAEKLMQDHSFHGDVQGLRDRHTSSAPVKLRRLFIIDPSLEAVPTDVKRLKSLRTLVFLDARKIRSVPKSLFKNLSSLRILDLSGTSIDKLPDSIGDLTILKHLDVSKTKIIEIPGAIRNLSKLWFLILRHCTKLHRLPEGVVKLCNLRDLDLHGTPLEGLPEGMGELKQLNRLTGFVVNSSTNNRTYHEARGGRRRRDKSPQNQDKWCSLKDLGKLSFLRFLRIEKLESILSTDDARAAVLKGKQHLKDLRLLYSLSGDGEPPIAAMEMVEAVLNELVPPERLELLVLCGYSGRKFPTWMMERSLFSEHGNVSHLPYLRRLELIDCSRCQRLPPLYMLPQLEYLLISGAASITTIGPEFLFYENDERGGEYPAIPKLKHLIFRNMCSWEQWLWDDIEQPLPHLKILELKRCPSLKSFPAKQLRALETLLVDGAQSLTEIKDLSGLENMEIVDSPNLQRISCLDSLRNLTIANCTLVKVDKGLPALRYLKWQDFLTSSLPEWLSDDGILGATDDRETPYGNHKGEQIGEGGIHALTVIANVDLLKSTTWSRLQKIPVIRAYKDDGSLYKSYKTQGMKLLQHTTESNVETNSDGDVETNSDGFVSDNSKEPFDNFHPDGDTLDATPEEKHAGTNSDGFVSKNSNAPETYSGPTAFPVSFEVRDLAPAREGTTVAFPWFFFLSLLLAIALKIWNIPQKLLDSLKSISTI